MAVRRIIEPGHRLESMEPSTIRGRSAWRWTCQCGHSERTPLKSRARDEHALHKHEVRQARHAHTHT